MVIRNVVYACNVFQIRDIQSSNMSHSDVIKATKSRSLYFPTLILKDVPSERDSTYFSDSGFIF